MLAAGSPAFNLPHRSISKRVQASDRPHSQSASYQFKPTHLSAYRMEIGEWSETAEFNGVLTLKIYHCRGQIVFERMCRGRKRKVQYDMQHLDQIYLYHHTPRVSVADFFVKQPPLCFCEIDPAPRSNTTWEACEDDFCGGQSSMATSVRCYLKTTTSTKHFIRLQSHPLMQSKIFFRPPSHEDWIRHHNSDGTRLTGSDVPSGAPYAKQQFKEAQPVYTGWSNLYVQHVTGRLGLRDDCDDGDSSATHNSSFPSSPSSDYESLDDGIQGRERYLNFDCLKGLSETYSCANPCACSSQANLFAARDP